MRSPLFGYVGLPAEYTSRVAIEPCSACWGRHRSEIWLQGPRVHGDGGAHLRRVRKLHCPGSVRRAWGGPFGRWNGQSRSSGRVAGSERRRSGRSRSIHVVGSGSERRRRGVGVDDAAVLPIDGRGGFEFRHGGRHAHGCGACSFRNQQPVGERDGADDGWHVPLRCLRGRGGERIEHGQQLLVIGADHGTGTGARPESGGVVSFGEQQRTGRRDDVHGVGIGRKLWGRILGGHDDAFLPLDGRNHHDIRHGGRHGHG